MPCGAIRDFLLKNHFAPRLTREYRSEESPDCTTTNDALDNRLLHVQRMSRRHVLEIGGLRLLGISLSQFLQMRALR